MTQTLTPDIVTAPHHYELCLHQGEVHIEVHSDDASFINRQLARWCETMIPGMPVMPLPPSAPKAAPVVEPEPEPPVAAPDEAFSDDAQVPEEIIVQTETVAEEVISVVPPVETLPAALIDDADSLVSTPVLPAEEDVLSEVLEDDLDALLNEIEQDAPAETVSMMPPMGEPVIQEDIAIPPPPPLPVAEVPAMPPAVEAEEDEDFEAMLDSLMTDLGPGESEEDELLAPMPPRHTIAPEPELEPEVSPGDETAPSSSSEGSGLEWIESFRDLREKVENPNPVQSLCLAGFYITYFEGTERFSLKHINTLMIRSGYPPINHGVIETAVGEHLLDLVPDTTGLAEVTEYQLTDLGRQISENLFDN